jgi:hypothetical protein
MTLNSKSAAVLLQQMNPRRARKLAVAGELRGLSPNQALALANGSGMAGGSIMQVVNGGNGCCPTDANGLPTLVLDDARLDKCRGLLLSNAKTDVANGVISYQRSQLYPQVNWSINSNAPVALAAPAGALQGLPVDGMIFWFPGIANVQIAGFITIRVQARSWKSGSGATVDDIDVTFKVAPGQNNGPVVVGYVFRDSNNIFTPGRTQAAGKIADSATGGDVTVSAQNVTVTLSNWPAAAAPVVAYPWNSGETWIAPYSARLAKELI